MSEGKEKKSSGVTYGFRIGFNDDEKDSMRFTVFE